MNPKIEWQSMKNHRYLVLHFDGHFSAENARNAISTISSMIRMTEEKIIMVWECTGMAGFDTAARESWSIFMRDIKSKIDKIHLISNKIVIRSGAVVVGIFAGIRIASWATWDELNAHS
jgi:hypothetical protein